MRSKQVLLIMATYSALLGAADTGTSTGRPPIAKHNAPATKSGNVVVALCDGKTTIEVEGLKPGEAMAPGRAQHVADELMTAWTQKNPSVKWEVVAADTKAARKKDEKGKLPAPGEISPEKKQVEAYGNYTSRDEFIWNQEYEKAITEGNRIFHDAKAFGGTVGISCDMCHPNAANTHPETYPKYQVQLQRVALLRDMINWCIENPTKGKPLADDDSRLRAMEAYIISQRKGVPMAPGKH